MSRIQLMRHAIELWYIPHVPKELCHANARKWVRSVERLGDRWLLARKVQRIQ
jgi:hypothetical protein